MKRYVTKKDEVEITSEIGKFCGFTTTDGLKGYLVYTGGVYAGTASILHAVLVQSGMTTPNVSCGRVSDNSFSSVEYFVRNANTVFSEYQVSVRVKDIYFFDTLKEMHKWLSE